MDSKIQHWEHVNILRLLLLFLLSFFIWIIIRKYIHRKTEKPLPKRYLPKKLRSRRFAYILWGRGIYQHYLDSLYKVEKVDKIRSFVVHAEEKLLQKCYMPVQLFDVQTAQNAKTQGGKDDTPKNIDIYTLINNSSGNVLILGEPGAGKTTLAKFLTLRLLEPNQTELDQHASYRQIRGCDVKEWFPIFINLERGTILTHKATTEADNQTTLKFIDRLALHVFWSGDLGQIPDKGKLIIAKQYATPLLTQLLNMGTAFIIVDGLEHLAAWQASEEDKAAFVSDLNQFTKLYCQPNKNFLLVTARDGDVIYGLSNWDQYKLFPLTSTQTKKQHFLKHYLSEEKANEITQEIVKYPRVNDAAQNPLLLSLIAYVYQHKGHKPEFAQVFNRVELYKQLVDGLWARWSYGYGELTSSKRDEVLCNLAYRLLKQRRFTFGESELEDSIKQVIGIQTNGQNSIEKAKADLDRASCFYPIQQKILHYRWGWQFWNRFFPILGSEWKTVEGSLTFIHFTFQEYFAFLWLRRNSSDNNFRELFIRFRDPWWQESLSLYLSQRPDAPKLIQKYLHEKKIVERLGQSKKMDIDGRNALLDMLCEIYKLEELRTLCFLLNVTYDDLAGEGRRDKARELIQFLERHGRQEELLELIYSQQIGHDIRDLFLFARILQEYTHLPNFHQFDELTRSNCEEVRYEVFAQMLSLVAQGLPSIHAHLKAISVLPGATDFFFDTYDKDIESILNSDQHVDRKLLILTLCAKIGGKHAKDILLKQFKETSDEKLEKGVAELLRECLHMPKLYLIQDLLELKKEQLSDSKEALILDLLASSESPNLLEPLINLEKEQNQASNRKAIVNLAYDVQLATLASPFYRYLLSPDTVTCQIIYRALQENAEYVVDALVARLLSYECTRLHTPIRHVLSHIGSSLEIQDSENYFNLIMLLMGTNQEEGLRILGDINDTEWATEILTKASQRLNYKNRAVLLTNLRIMLSLEKYYSERVGHDESCFSANNNLARNNSHQNDLRAFVLAALQRLSKYDQCWYLRYRAKRAYVWVEKQ